ncbi:hypothetical protein L2E82_20842 [Cichorium intybus]|uniref:Uncharacterized protein n=1 Tax=Cichorium intybus TaxID=13427 RepID=A0ACB9DV76_CICIN|nr:hypothetical protein L2E82_20842 [Cichorium intybus]
MLDLKYSSQVMIWAYGESIGSKARREKINARMKFLQELVPGCNKVNLSGSSMDCNFTGMVSQSWWLDGQVNGNTQLTWHPDGLNNFVTPETSLLTYDSSANSASWLTNQLKTEL